MSYTNGTLPGIIVASNVEEGYVSGGGIRFHYVAAGQGTPVVLLHGFPESWYSWRKQLEELAPCMRLYAFDLKGYGDSDKPAPLNSSTYHMATLTKELGEAINKLNVGPVVLAGHDWGGILAYIIAVRYPSLVSKLILLNTATQIVNPLRIPYIFGMQIPYLPEVFLEKFGDEVIRNCFESPLTLHPEAFTEEEIEFSQAEFRKPGVHVCSLAYYRSLFQGLGLLQAAQRKGLKMPATLIWGAGDPILTTDLAKKMATALPATLHIVEDAGHFVQSERPAEVNRILLQEIAVLEQDAAKKKKGKVMRTRDA